MKHSILIFAVLLFSISCKETKKAPEGTSQMERVIAIHDDVMPKMKTVGKLIDALETKADSPEKEQSYEAAIQDLKSANTAMMEWMENFGDQFGTLEILNRKTLTAQKQALLDEEEVKVKALREQIHTSIAKAEALLGKE